MGYGRDDSDWREREARGRQDRSRSGSERGFFERAGDEISSWFGDDDAERRRDMDDRARGRDRSRGGFFSGSDDRGSYDRSGNYDRSTGYDRGDSQRGNLWRDESSGRAFGSQSQDRDYGSDYGSRRPDHDRDRSYRSSSKDSSYRPMTGDYGRSSSDRYDRGNSSTSDRGQSSGYGSSALGAAAGAGATAAHDRHYSEWRQRQIDEIDRDYDDYRREHQSKFESDFSNWRSTRQSKRQMLGTIKEHMDVVGADDQPVGKVDKVRGDRLILTKSDSSDGKHHSVNCSMVDRVEGDRVILDRNADDARSQFGDEDRDRALFERDGDREAGPHILDRSFSGTY